MCVGGVSGVVALCVLTHITHRLKRERGEVSIADDIRRKVKTASVCLLVCTSIYMIHTHTHTDRITMGHDAVRINDGARSLGSRYVSPLVSGATSLSVMCVWVE